nr:aconitate hydratase [Nannocystis sp.]
MIKTIDPSMDRSQDPFEALSELRLADGTVRRFYSLPALTGAGLDVSRLPRSLRVILESVLRNLDGHRISEDDVRSLAGWTPNGERSAEIPFVVARIVLQDFTGVPLLVDLAAMRSAVARMGRDPAIIEPLVPVDLVVDHSVQVDFAGVHDALARNMAIEFHRNRQRYEFLKWGTTAFNGFNVVPPGVGIVHQVNLEHLARGVLQTGDVLYPDTLVGTDSHTTMINGLGVVGWGVGGIEAEAGMLGQPVYFLTPDVVGVHLRGTLAPGVTATDLVLTITELLRRRKVVGKFVEFFGEGAASLSVTDRATIANMAPEYGATMGYFPVDERSCQYMHETGRSDAEVDALRRYYVAQQMFGMPADGDIDYSERAELDLAGVEPSVAGPRRPQDRIRLADLRTSFSELLHGTDGAGYGKPPNTGRVRLSVVTRAPDRMAAPVSGGGEQDSATMPVYTAPSTSPKNTNPETEIEMMQNRPTPDRVDAAATGPATQLDLHDGAVVIAAITSCTNTSNPSVMIAAGLVAQKAVERGLRVSPAVKTSLAPGSRVVTHYLTITGLQPFLDRLGFQVVGYGCTTCIGNSGPLDPNIERAVIDHDLVVASVLSGNRNFEARIHQSIRANFLMSPPLVVAFALAGRIDIDMTSEPLGHDTAGQPVYLRDLWPTSEEIGVHLSAATNPTSYRALYDDLAASNPMWAEIPASGGKVYAWDETSTYIQDPPYFEKFSLAPCPPTALTSARALASFGDSVTTDHISPAGAISPDSPAGQFLRERGVATEDFNSYGSRRGNDRVMVRGTFANVRIKNLMVPGVEGGVTVHQPDGTRMSIYDAAIRYQAAGIPLVIFAGQEYGTGSSRDWAAKGTRLLGVRAVIAASFERIHRSNLVGMGVLPCQFDPGTDATTLNIDGTETFDLRGLESGVQPRQRVTLHIHRASGESLTVPLTLRIDTPIEVDYLHHGGILPFVLRQRLGGGIAPAASPDCEP